MLYAFQIPIFQNGILAALPYLFDFAMIVFGSQLADLIRKKKWLSTEVVRKIFNSFGENLKFSQV